MALSSDIASYRNEVFNFLQSLTLKYSPLADLINNALEAKGYEVDPDDPSTWKYYMNLQGQYHPTDTVMTVVSLDTRETIDYTIANLAIHTRTAQAYIPGSAYFTELCLRYSTQVDLIKSIRYPSGDFDDIYSADELSILSYGTGFLEDSESSYIITDLIQKLKYLANRWFQPYLGNEPYYFVTFWAILWQLLPQVIFSARFIAQRTPHVHSWYVLEYLQSVANLGDYSDVLDRQRLMYLYRNIDYLLAHRGTRKNLIELTDNLLDVVGIGLFERRVVSTPSGDPSIIAVKIPTKYSSYAEDAPTETVQEIVIRQYASGDEVDTSQEHITDLTDKLSTTLMNNSPTKLLEIRPLVKGKRYVEFFTNLVIDQTVAGILEGYYAPIIELSLSDTGVAVQVSGKDALALLFYCDSCSVGTTPGPLPSLYTPQAMYRSTMLDIPESFNYDGVNYYTNQVLDVTGFVDNYLGLFPTTPLADPLRYSEFLSSLFLKAMTQIDRMRAALDYLPQSRAVEYVANAMMHNGTVPMTLSDTVSTYDAWKAANPDLTRNIINVLEASDDPKTAFSDMASTILTELIPITPTMETYGNFAATTDTYTKLKNLFIQMCSYAVTFLDSDLEIGTVVYVASMGLATKDSVGTDGTVWEPAMPQLRDSAGTYPIEATLAEVTFAESDHLTNKTLMSAEGDVDYAFQVNGTDDIAIEEERETIGVDKLVSNTACDLSVSIVDTVETTPVIKKPS